MRLQELITEKRSNPELNPKNTGHAAAVKYLQDQSQLSRWGVSMTDIPKLGINPSSLYYETPLGIYFYPARYYLKAKRNNSPLDFKDNASYIQVFKYGGMVVDLNTMGYDVLDYCIGIYDKNLNAIGKLINYPEKNNIHGVENLEIDDWFQAMIDVAEEENPYDSPGGQLWYILEKISSLSNETADKSNSTTRNIVVWNKLLRMVGIDVLLDTGAGIIHYNEPNQGLVVNPKAIVHVHTIKTNNKTKKTDNSQYRELAAASDADLNFVTNVISQINKGELIYTTANAKECNIIIAKCLQYLNQNPGQFNKHVDLNDLNALLSLASNKSIVAKFCEAYYKSKWPKLKKFVDGLDRKFKDSVQSYEAEQERNYAKINAMEEQYFDEHEILRIETEALWNKFIESKKYDREFAGEAARVISEMYDYCNATLKYMDKFFGRSISRHQI